MPRSTIRPPCWNRLKDYDSRVVQTIWEDSISLDLSLEDPFFAQSNSQYNDLVTAAHDGIKKARKKLDPLNFNRDLFRRSSYKEQRTLDSMFRFEARMLNLNHSVCSSCYETRRSPGLSRRREEIVRGVHDAHLQLLLHAKCKREEELPSYLSSWVR